MPYFQQYADKNGITLKEAIDIKGQQNECRRNDGSCCYGYHLFAPIGCVPSVIYF